MAGRGRQVLPGVLHSRRGGRRHEGDTVTRTPPPPPGFGISVRAPADPAERPGVRRVKRVRGGNEWEGGVQRSCRKVSQAKDEEHIPPAFGKVLALFMIVRGWSGPQLREGTAQGHWCQPGVLQTGNAICCSPIWGTGRSLGTVSLCSQ